MQTNRTKHRQFMTWPRTKGHLESMRRIGPKLTQLGLFFFDVRHDGSLWSSVDTIENNEAGRTPVLQDIMQVAQQVKEQWPHITMLLTIKNDGFESIFRSILTDPAAQNRLIGELHRILDEFSWCDGVDIDLERGPNDLKEEIYTLLERFYSEVKGRASNRHVHIDLPPMTGPGVTVGPENWCEYERIAPLCDTAQIMTYGFAWSGSAPGATTPIPWLRSVLRYATQAFHPEQVFTGAPAYGHRWQITDYPENVGQSNNWRGVAGGFEPFLRWMLGDLSHTDQYRTGTETQAYIPYASFYEDTDYCHWLYLHVYDYPGADDVDSTSLTRESYDGKRFLTAYSKRQVTSFTGTVVDQRGTDYVSRSGAMGEDQSFDFVYPRTPAPLRDGNGNIIGYEDPGYARWQFSVSTTGQYDLVVRVNFPWWSNQRLGFMLNGQRHTVGNVPQWYPYFRTTHWVSIGRFQLSSGTHTLELRGQDSQVNTQFYGFRVCQSFSDEHYAGEAAYTLKPRTFTDRDRNPAWPHENKFKLTLETLRRAPEHVHVWYDDFRDWDRVLPSNMYNIVSGSWQVAKSTSDPSARPYSWLTGSGEVRITYDQFEHLSVRATLRLDQLYGRAGVVFGNVWLCVNTHYGRIDLYEGESLLGTYYPSNPLRSGTMYTIRVRVRGREVCGYLGTTKILTRQLSSSPQSSFGLKSDVTMTTDLLIAADAHWYYPQEALEVKLPNGDWETLGRIPRIGVTWNQHWGFFQLLEGEERDTRQKGEDGLPTSLSLDWDYVHSSIFELSAPQDYPVELRVKDIGAWVSNLFLGDADGFSIVVFPDADTMLRIADIAAYEFGILGVGMWTIGQEDERLWEMLIDHA
ncbi:glycosyl hydrolase family 18 protein [Bacillus horti]|uniref:Spore germination protein YaaH n=1 Tax=Caldalkalibacillus horti TaxID=77523 RepID=A0ABT9W5P0_9BACI|nr:glycosyl hydrolase family 18 protein [Bacillus horti]MDQ0168440.1 spore germination protein YaaH [Bacillus horti]